VFLRNLNFVSVILLLVGPALAQESELPVPEVVVVTGSAPLPAFGLEAEKLPGQTQTLSITDLLQDRITSVLPELIARELPGVATTDEEGSLFQPDLVYRGFEASSVGGDPEGLAVYQNGVRINEAFGDNVNWDLIPEFAVERLTVQSDNPAFGLNALGGAVSLQMKDGFSGENEDAQITAGSFGRMVGDAEASRQWGKWATYLGLGSSHDDGYRAASASTLRQVYADLGYAAGRWLTNFSASAAWNDIEAPGPTPVQLLAGNPRAVFTTPQATQDGAALVQLRSVYQKSSNLLFSGNVYFRRFHLSTFDGNTSDVARCENNAAQLCLQGNDLFPADGLYDEHGNPVPASVLPDGATPAEIDRTTTRTDTYGMALQGSWRTNPLGLQNLLVAGTSVDRGDTSYHASGELGSMLNSLHVNGVGVIIDQSLSPSASPPIEGPVDVEAQNTYGGIYAVNSLDLTSALTWTLSARMNVADISLADKVAGTAAETHDFISFNPGTGVTYKFSDALSVYAGVSRSNRAPTPGELSCANPATPCLLAAFLNADPPLNQVISQTFEFGMRGKGAIAGGALRWDVSAYRTDLDDDILLVATSINGFGYFRNAGETRRQGVDANIAWSTEDGWSFRAGYDWLSATFQTPLILPSVSPAANAQGLIFVSPGDRLPLNPVHRATVGVDYDGLSWRAGADLRAQSEEFLNGDESNQEPELSGRVTVDIHGAVSITENLELFAEIDNFFDAHYESSGAFTDLENLPPNFALTDPRSVVPAPSRQFFIGLRVHA
jgi:iron complex outermembrane receptor protein